MSPNRLGGPRLPGLNPFTLTPLALVLTAVLQAHPALAQSVILPSGPQGAYVNNQTGQPGAVGTGDDKDPQPGGAAPAGPDLEVQVNGGTTLTAGGSGPTLGLSVTGGQGGAGNDTEGGNSGPTGGDGGLGGTPGELSLTLAEGTQVNSSSSGPAAVSVQSTGGMGGFSGGYDTNNGASGAAGSGGDGGAVIGNLSGSIVSKQGWVGTTPGATALLMSSIGGAGAGPNPANSGSGESIHTVGDSTGRSGGAGGDGGSVTLNTQTASFVSGGTGVQLLSQGGAGSVGVNASASGGTARGGYGGKGGSGGQVTATLIGEAQNPGWLISAVGSPVTDKGNIINLPQGNTAETSFLSAGVAAQSFGGDGGLGGIASGPTAYAGGGGAAGSGGGVQLTVGDINVSTTGHTAPAILAQSIGGSGGDGASAGSVFKAKSGNGAIGGNGSDVSVKTFSTSAGDSAQTTISTVGNDASGIVAQSIGGGGGAGGDVSTGSVIAGFAVGGNGETGGTAGTVTVNNGDYLDAFGKPLDGAVILTQGDRSNGITAMSIGGGGGSGGNASSTVGGVFDMTVGGTGGSGGSAGQRGTLQVSAANNGVIQTSGAHSVGMQAMAIGGGGGNGGSASSVEGGAQLDVTVAVGGKGAKAGDAGDVQGLNDGQILTQNNDAYGMQVMSAGGGGGNGGASKAAAYQLINSSEAPSLNFTLSIGGQGGAGGDGGNVTGTNDFSIVTNGTGSHGLLVQSIGGGGGNGGDSSATQLNTKGSTLNINMAIGGDGKGGGSGGSVTANNNGLIWTMANDSSAIAAQSIGGGGGNGGVGSADSGQFADNDSSKAGELELGIGGGAGTGDTGGSVTVNNSAAAAIITLGDNAHGILAQSIGGGGGNGGGGVANGSSGTLNARVAVGGNGGSGNTGGSVTVNNAGSIVTGGGDASAIYAQSVGGGGGKGGNDPQTQLFNYLEKSLPSVVTTYSNNTQGFVPNASSLFDKGVNKVVGLVKGYYTQNSEDGAKLPAAGDGNGDLNMTLNIGGGFAGKGGTGGDGGTVDVLNASTGAIHTLGPMADGIFALSVGGGGGAGGLVSASNNSSEDPAKMNATIAVGGQGGAAGNGNDVSVTNNGSIATEGSASVGILAASIGGGGGVGGFTSTGGLNGNTKPQTVNVQLGGNSGATGDGGGVAIYSMPDLGGGPATLVSTSGSYAAGIAGLSIGGGGGLVSLNDTTSNPLTGGAVSTGGLTMSGFQLAGKDAVQACGGTAATCGGGGPVLVMAQNVQTSGINAPGVLAQSIGGSGGWLQAAATGAANYFAVANGVVGDGSSASVHVLGNVATSGAGSYGVIAQSVGGGGLLGGDFSITGDATGAFTPQNRGLLNLGSTGNGSAVIVDVPVNASVTTTGSAATGIFAQSVGGGGGLVASDGTAYMGTAGGTGTSGPITVQVDGAVATTGNNAPAIFVNADGSSASSNATAVKVTGTVSSQNGNTIVFNSNATSNTVTNSGTIEHGPSSGYAVDSLRGVVTVDNQASGTLGGAVRLNGGTLTNAGTWAPQMGTVSSAAEVDSSGNVQVGNGLSATNQAPNTLLTGHLNSSGTLTSSVDFAGGQVSTLNVFGAADLSGTVKINPVTMASTSAQILTASQGLTTSNLTVEDASNYLYKYTPQITSDSLSVTQNAQFSSAARAAGLSRNAQQLADHLQANYDAGAQALSPLYGALDQVSNPGQYRATLAGLSAEALQMVGVARLTASEAFVNRMNSCPDNDASAAGQHERDCLWARAVDQNSSVDGSDGDRYSLTNHVFQIGGQHQIADGWWLGGSVAYNDGEESSSSGVGGVTDHSYSLGAVIKREWGPWTFSGALDVAQGSYRSSRNLQVGDQRLQAHGSFDGYNLGLHSRVSYLAGRDDWYVKPYLDVHAVNIHTDSFRETNAGALGLKVDAGNDTLYTAAPMLEAGKHIHFANGAELTPSVSVGRSFSTGDDWNTDMRLIGSDDSVGSFNSQLSTPRQVNQYAAGLNLKVNATSEVRLDYTGQSGDGYRMNEGAIRFTHFF
ncbi:hypothetical protein HNP46_003755 [Pseudomonas nitritireducens]|uniref:Autotransporter domain-containing protein n=1 Tax=Pseudomonas nitroreducens TaxID=46680 RepID=A0A7W7KM68_PSENT|nr:autotransporter outer membrane beta-barrel domain-containing protein [Pseudomonas nitritireducens]MBB4864879.1 hypothetical protein [Pseudomonas nitritireducens]